MNVLVINAGSSSLKYQLMDPATGNVTAKGLCERIGLDGRLTHKALSKGTKVEKDIPMPTHKEAIEAVMAILVDPQDGERAQSAFLPDDRAAVLKGQDVVGSCQSFAARAEGGQRPLPRGGVAQTLLHGFVQESFKFRRARRFRRAEKRLAAARFTPEAQIPAAKRG